MQSVIKAFENCTFGSSFVFSQTQALLVSKASQSQAFPRPVLDLLSPVFLQLKVGFTMSNNVWSLLYIVILQICNRSLRLHSSQPDLNARAQIIQVNPVIE